MKQRLLFQLIKGSAYWYAPIKAQQICKCKKTTDHTHLPGNDYMLYVHMFENKCAIYYSTNSHDLLQLETFFGYEL